MSFLLSWVEGVAAAAIICSVTLILSPSGRLEKSVKTVVSFVLITAFFLPFIKGDVSFGELDSSIIQSENEKGYSYIESAKDGMQKALYKKIALLLSQNGINYTDIIINIEVNEKENAVDVKSIVIITDYDGSESLQNLIQNETGVPAVIKTEEEQ